MERYTKMTCSKCGSEDVKVDAWAAWNKETQTWELEGTYDHAFCESCDGECTIAEVQEAATA